jgi:hypothetical protein
MANHNSAKGSFHARMGRTVPSMQIRLACFTLAFATVSWAAEPESKPAPERKISSRLSQEVRARLPKYDPSLARRMPATGSEPTPADVILMPKMEVREGRLPSNDPDDYLNKRERRKKQVDLYMDSMSGLDRVLNGFSVPFLTPSVAGRAKGAAEAREIENLQSIIDVSRAIDPAGAAKLTRELSPPGGAEFRSMDVRTGR